MNDHQHRLIEAIKTHTNLFTSVSHKNGKQICEILNSSHLVCSERERLEHFSLMGHFLSPVLMVVQQAGGKYGIINCLCGHKAHYKFSSSSGWCDHCGLTFDHTGGLAIPLTGEKAGPYIIEFEVRLSAKDRIMRRKTNV